MSTQNTTLNLDLVEDIIYDDIGLLLDAMDLDYTEMGNNIFMPCPIHGSDNPRSLSISLDKRVWKCWTHDCEQDRGVSIFDFIVLTKNCTFSEVIKLLVDVYDLNDRGVSKAATDKVEKGELHDIIRIFSKQYEERIEPEYVKLPDTLGSSLYFEGRGFSPDTLKHFGVEDCMNKTAMHRRAIIPIHDEDGKLCGYIARKTKEFMEQKYLYARGFQKSKYLYNYHRAIPKMKNGHLYVTEGQGDVWRMYEAGYENCVGLLGKEMHDYQMGLLLKSGATKLTIVTDNDQPSRESKVNMLRKLNRMFKLVFPRMKKKDIGDMTIEEIREMLGFCIE